MYESFLVELTRARLRIVVKFKPEKKPGQALHAMMKHLRI